jgi:hypothetical protein
MSKPFIKIVNVETGEEIEREMTDVEFEQYEADIEKAKVKDAKAAAKAAQRQALLDKLGITEDEARLLLGGN